MPINFFALSPPPASLQNGASTTSSPSDGAAFSDALRHLAEGASRRIRPEDGTEAVSLSAHLPVMITPPGTPLLLELASEASALAPSSRAAALPSTIERGVLNQASLLDVTYGSGSVSTATPPATGSAPPATGPNDRTAQARAASASEIAHPIANLLTTDTVQHTDSVVDRLVVDAASTATRSGAADALALPSSLSNARGQSSAPTPESLLESPLASQNGMRSTERQESLIQVSPTLYDGGRAGSISLISHPTATLTATDAETQTSRIVDRPLLDSTSIGARGRAADALELPSSPPNARGESSAPAPERLLQGALASHELRGAHTHVSIPTLRGGLPRIEAAVPQSHDTTAAKASLKATIRHTSHTTSYGHQSHLSLHAGAPAKSFTQTFGIATPDAHPGVVARSAQATADAPEPAIPGGDSNARPDLAALISQPVKAASELASATPALEVTPFLTGQEAAAPIELAAGALGVAPVESAHAFLDAFEPLPLGPHRPMPDPALLSGEIVKRFERGTSAFDIRLDPAELGHVHVRLEVGPDDLATAVISAEKPETLSDLIRASRELERHLQEAGVRLAENSLTFDLAGASTSDRRGGRAMQGRAAAGADDGPDDVIDASERARPFGFERWNGAGVDIKI